MKPCQSESHMCLYFVQYIFEGPSATTVSLAYGQVSCVWGIVFLISSPLSIPVITVRTNPKCETLFPVGVNGKEVIDIRVENASRNSPVPTQVVMNSARETIIIIASDCLSELFICMTLTKCHYPPLRKLTKGILEKNKTHLWRNNYLLSSGDEVIITVKTRTV